MYCKSELMALSQPKITRHSTPSAHTGIRLKKISAGIINDDSFYPAIYAAGKDDDWKDPKTWAKANPNFGVTVQESFYQQECAKAISLDATKP